MVTKLVFGAIIFLAGLGVGLPTGKYWAENPKIEIILKQMPAQSEIVPLPDAENIFIPNGFTHGEQQTTDPILF